MKGGLTNDSNNSAPEVVKKSEAESTREGTRDEEKVVETKA